MSFMRAPKPPAPDPKLIEAQKRQEERLEAEEAQKAAAIAARLRARRVGGQRLLLSMDRETPQTGVQDTLGA